MNEFDDLRDFMVERIGNWLEKMPEAIRTDVYAASLFIDEQGVEIIFSLNTNSRIKAAMAGQAGMPVIPALGLTGLPSDEAEAKWNYAFWLQNPNVRFLSPEGSQDAELWEMVLKKNSLPASDEEYEELDEEDLDRVDQKRLELMAELAIAVSMKLHQDMILQKTLKKVVPVLVHQLEYYDLTLKWTTAANPPGVAAEFNEYMSCAEC